MEKVDTHCHRKGEALDVEELDNGSNVEELEGVEDFEAVQSQTSLSSSVALTYFEPI